MKKGIKAFVAAVFTLIFEALIIGVKAFAAWFLWHEIAAENGVKELSYKTWVIIVLMLDFFHRTSKKDAFPKVHMETTFVKSLGVLIIAFLIVSLTAIIKDIF